MTSLIFQGGSRVRAQYGRELADRIEVVDEINREVDVQIDVIWVSTYITCSHRMENHHQALGTYREEARREVCCSSCKQCFSWSAKRERQPILRHIKDELI